MKYFQIFGYTSSYQNKSRTICISNILPFLKMEHFLSQIMMAKQDKFVIKESGLQTFGKNQLELREEELNHNHKQKIARGLEYT